MLTRRRFAFWLGFGLFGLAEKLRVYGLDELAAAMMDAAGEKAGVMTGKSAPPTHWRVADNAVWRWLERETFIDGKWTLSGITTPVNKESGERYQGREGYLAESLAPEELRADFANRAASGESVTVGLDPEHLDRDPSEKRRARHGRPPSKWLRSLNADELRLWLKTIDVPEADVSGMTFWTHLTRDHSFDPERIEGLLIDEQAKLHAAAHYGY